MNAEQETTYYLNEWSNHLAYCRTFGVNPFPANLTTRYDKDGNRIEEKYEKTETGPDRR